MAMLEIHSWTRSLQSTHKFGLHEGTDILMDIAPYRLYWPRGRCSENPPLSFAGNSIRFWGSPLKNFF